MSERGSQSIGPIAVPTLSRSMGALEDTSMATDRLTGDVASLAPSSYSPHELHQSPLPQASARFNHLPTPHSPKQFGHYTYSQSPQSPLAPSSTYGGSRTVFDEPRQLAAQSTPSSRQVQMITPDSSPFIPRVNSVNGASHSAARPNASRPVGIPFRIAASPPHFHDETSRQPPSNPYFMAKLMASDRQHRLSPTSGPGPMQVDDVFSASSSSFPPRQPPSSPPTSPHANTSSSTTMASSTPTSLVPPPGSGGEIGRIRQVLVQEQQELETRRPDYLQRHKREAESASFSESFDAVHPSVGILESPNKGRRLTLFQETSEESFEESLMAGGYGVYRTAEWVRQPQPLLVTTPGSAGPSKMLSALEEAIEPPPISEKEQKKRKRVEAFRSDSAIHKASSTLFPVELEGKGRVLLDIPNESLTSDSHPRKRGQTRRRKKGELPKEGHNSAVLEERTEAPNWPDSEFPWRLRTEERTELAKAEERERLAWIEKYFERDTDDEEEGTVNSEGRDNGEEAVIPSSQWGVVYEDSNDRPTPAPRGRGKMIPLSADPAAATNLDMRRRRSYFPSDPADARAALMSKRSVRALSFRRDNRLRGPNCHEKPNRLCICRGFDDGRQLVQCDDCKMWYHLQCLGISDISELGPEEKPWFCTDCQQSSSSRASSSEPEDVEMPYREPTFAPTDDTPRIRRTYDTAFLNSSAPSSSMSGLHDSPLPSWNASRLRLPRTPVREPRDVNGSMRPDPRFETPRGQRERRAPDEHYDDIAFDPTSTPSRGVRLAPPPAFATPKTTLFGGARSNGPFQTPSRRVSSGGSSSRVSSSSNALEESSTYGRFPVSGFHYDDSPVRHTARRNSLGGGSSTVRGRLEDHRE